MQCDVYEAHLKPKGKTRNTSWVIHWCTRHRNSHNNLIKARPCIHGDIEPLARSSETGQKFHWLVVLLLCGLSSFSMGSTDDSKRSSNSPALQHFLPFLNNFKSVMAIIGVLPKASGSSSDTAARLESSICFAFACSIQQALLCHQFSHRISESLH